MHGVAVSAGPRLVERSFGDFDAFARNTDWELDFCQLGRGVVEIPARVLLLQHCEILEIGCNRAYHQRGQAPADRLTFGLPQSGVRRWFNRSAEGAGLMHFNNPSGFDCVSDPGFCATTISLRKDFVLDTIEALKLPLPDVLLQSAEGALRAESSGVQTVIERRAAMYRLLRALD